MNEEVRRAISLIPAELLRLAAESADVRAAIVQTAQLTGATLRAMQNPAVLDVIARLQAGADYVALFSAPIGNEGTRALAAAMAKNATLSALVLSDINIDNECAQALAAALANNSALTALQLDRTGIGVQGARAIAAALRNNATLTVLRLERNYIGDEGAQALAATLNNAKLTELRLDRNGIGFEGARALAAALRNNATLTNLCLYDNIVGEEGERALAAALDTNRTLQHILCHFRDAELAGVIYDRLRLNRIAALSMPAWVASAAARSWVPTFRIPPVLAARAAMLAFGEELLDTDDNPWFSPGGRKFALDYLRPRAEAALQAELGARRLL